MWRLDELDRKLLAMLVENGRESFASLGHRIGLSTAATKRRVDRLRDARVIRRFTAEVEAALVDLAREYDAADRGFELRLVAGGWRYYTRERYAAVVESFTGILTDVIGVFGGVPDFSSASVAGIGIGAFINAVLSFLLTAAVLYFLVVTPFNKLSERLKREAEQPEAAPAVTSEDLLTEIRDLMREQATPRPPSAGQVP